MPFPHPSKLIFLVPQDFKSSLVTWGLMLTCPGTTGCPLLVAWPVPHTEINMLKLGPQSTLHRPISRPCLWDHLPL